MPAFFLSKELTITVFNSIKRLNRHDNFLIVSEHEHFKQGECDGTPSENFLDRPPGYKQSLSIQIYLLNVLIILFLLLRSDVTTYHFQKDESILH